MKKLLYIILLLPLWVNAQTNGTIQKTSATGTIRGSFGSLGLDTLTRVTGALVDGYILKYHAATNKWYASPDPTSSLYWQRSGTTLSPLTTGDNILTTGNVTADTLKSSANGMLYGASGVVTGNPLMTFSNDSTITFRGQKFIQNVSTSQFPMRYSTIFGYGAGADFKLGTQGYANSLFGNGAGAALRSNVASEASSNALFGDSAGGGIVTGTANSIFGTVAAGSANFNKVISIGWHSMLSASAGDESVVVGTYALPVNTAQSQQSVVGSLGFFGNTTGKRLAGLGYAVGATNVSGSDLTLLGWGADVTGNYSQGVGIGTKVLLSRNNMLNIGNLIYGNGIDTAARVVNQIGIGIPNPSAVLHLKEGSTAAGTAPIKFTSGSLLTTPEAGTMEFDGTNLYFTPVATRRTVAFTSDLGSLLPITGGTPSFSGTITSTKVTSPIFTNTAASTGSKYWEQTNTGAQLYWGNESSTGASLVSGAGAYTSFISTGNATDLVLGTNLTKRATVTSSGIDVVGNITAANLASGTYTPTLTNVLNVDGTSPSTFFYTRVGNIVTVQGSLTAASTSGTTQSEVGITLPVASNLSGSSDVKGNGTQQADNLHHSVVVTGDATNDRAVLTFYSISSTASTQFYFSFSYEVL